MQIFVLIVCKSTLLFVFVPSLKVSHGIENFLLRLRLEAFTKCAGKWLSLFALEAE
jgi:hypothetical protein